MIDENQSKAESCLKRLELFIRHREIHAGMQDSLLWSGYHQARRDCLSELQRAKSEFDQNGLERE
jgi:hypothetical protein